MPHVDTPWVGIVAIVLMFAIPFLPSWLFEGPRVVKHRPRRHVCAVCDAPWHPDHACAPAADAGPRSLRGHLERTDHRPALASRTTPPTESGNF